MELMNLLQCVVLLQVAAVMALGQSAQPSKLPSPFTQPEALVRSLYTEVVARHPHDIPADAEMKIFAPYLSQGLLHKIDLAKTCSADWDRQNPEPRLKARDRLFVWTFHWRARCRTAGIQDQENPGGERWLLSCVCEPHTPRERGLACCCRRAE